MRSFPVLSLTGLKGDNSSVVLFMDFSVGLFSLWHCMSMVFLWLIHVNIDTWALLQGYKGAER